MRYKIFMKFHGTGVKLKKCAGYKVPVLNGKKYINFLVKENLDNTTLYEVSGPNVFDLGKSSINSAIKNGIDIINSKIDSLLPFDKQIIVYLSGHSRGAVTATRVADKLRSIYSVQDKVKINLNVTEPYAGPTHKGKNTNMDLEKNSGKNGNKKKLSGSTIFYSMGTLFKCSPQRILGADRIFICAKGHNDTGGAIYKINFNDLSEGVYISDENWNITPITLCNLQDSIKKISKYEKSYIQRTKILTDIIAAKLEVKPDIFPKYLPEYENLVKKTINQIQTSANLRSAFNKAFNLFEPKGFLYGYVKKEGEFYKHLNQAAGYCVGIKNNRYNMAINELKIAKNCTKMDYTERISNALIARIKKWYSLRDTSDENINT